MDQYLKSTIIFFIAMWFGTNLQAQEDNFNLVVEEIKRITQAEIDAFRLGDCDTAVDFMDENITFYGNGRKVPSKEIIKKFCFSLTRPFEKPSSIDTQYYPLTENSAYVVRMMEFAKDDKVYKKEVVTKVWKKGHGGWKIMHLHSTIQAIAEN